MRSAFSPSVRKLSATSLIFPPRILALRRTHAFAHLSMLSYANAALLGDVFFFRASFFAVPRRENCTLRRNLLFIVLESENGV